MKWRDLTTDLHIFIAIKKNGRLSTQLKWVVTIKKNFRPKICWPVIFRCVYVKFGSKCRKRKRNLAKTARVRNNKICATMTIILFELNRIITTINICYLATSKVKIRIQFHAKQTETFIRYSHIFIFARIDFVYFSLLLYAVGAVAVIFVAVVELQCAIESCVHVCDFVWKYVSRRLSYF